MLSHQPHRLWTRPRMAARRRSGGTRAAPRGAWRARRRRRTRCRWRPCLAVARRWAAPRGASTAFGAQARALTALARGANGAMGDALGRRALALRGCGDGVTERFGVDAYAVAAAWEAALNGSLGLALHPRAGVGLVAARDVAYPPAGRRVLPLVGVLVVSGDGAADRDSLAELPASERTPGLAGSLTGPLALVNAGCSVCANVQFVRVVGGHGHVLFKAKLLRAVSRGEALCASYALGVTGGRCVLCDEPIAFRRGGQGSVACVSTHAAAAHARHAASWRTFRTAYGQTYVARVINGRSTTLWVAG